MWFIILYMKNIFVRFFLVLAFILISALNVHASADLGITSVVFDDSSSILSINSFDNDTYEFIQQPKLYILSDEHKAYFDINSAVLKCPVQNFILKSQDVEEIVVSQFSTNPNIVRVVIYYKDGFNPANIQLKKVNNTLFLRFKNPVMNNYYFQYVYGDSPTSDFYESVVIQTPIIDTDSSLLGQINSAFNLSPMTNDKNYILAKKDLVLHSRYYLDNINFKNNIPIITGVGAYTLSKPMYLSNPARVAYDISNTVVNPIIRNKEIKFNTSDTIKVGQFDRSTARVVITSATPDRYIPVVYGDSQRLIFIDKLAQNPQTLYTSKVDWNSILYEKTDNKTHAMKLIFSKPLVYGIVRTSNSIELLMYNVDKYSEGAINSTLKNTAFADAKISTLPKGGVKFVLPVSKDDIIDIHAGADGKTIRIREQFKKIQLPVPSLEPAITVAPIVIPKLDNKKYVVIDPGHGGSDVGATRNGIYEKNITLDISKRVAELLRKKGYIVEMTRTTDKTVSLQERVEFSEEISPDIFVSIHVNSSNSDSPSGLETHYYKDNSLDLAKNVHASLLNNINSKDRGLFKSKFYVINHTTAPAILVEIGFISNPTERAQLVSESRKQATAKAIAEGIYDYFK